jgi:hypothetical protein
VLLSYFQKLIWSHRDVFFFFFPVQQQLGRKTLFAVEATPYSLPVPETIKSTNIDLSMTGVEARTCAPLRPKAMERYTCRKV